MALSSSPLTRQIASGVAECCAALQIAPTDLTQGQFIKWLREDKELTKGELREVSVHLQQIGGFQALRNAFFASAPTEAAVDKIQLRGLAKLGREDQKLHVAQHIFLGQFEKIFSGVLSRHNRVRPFGFSTSKKRGEKEERIVNLALSDLHFGSKLDPREVPHQWDFPEESRRLASVIQRVADFKRDYRSSTTLHVWLGGDIIKGTIHDVIAGRPLAEQAADALWLLTQAFTILAGEYPKVVVKCSTGNHGRNPQRHDQRATSAKWDSFETIIYYGVKMGLAHLPNVTVEIPRTGHCDLEIFGRRLYATHGDTHLSPGNPGSSINVKALENKMTKINVGESKRGLKEYDAFLVGHVHVGSLVHLAPGSLITNGCLIPPDPYAISETYSASQNGQVLFESTPARIVGDYRFLDVDDAVDRDSSLDKIIVPFSGDF